VQWHI